MKKTTCLVLALAAGLVLIGCGRHPVRWATASKSEITTAIYQWSRERMEQSKKAEALPPETEARISEYEALRMQLLQMRAPLRPAAADEEYEAMSKRVAEAKAPVAAIVDRRERQAAEYYKQYSAERLIAEYVKGRYDLVVDSREKVLYQTAGEITDITEGVLALFNAKTRQ